MTYNFFISNKGFISADFLFWVVYLIYIFLLFLLDYFNNTLTNCPRQLFQFFLFGAIKYTAIMMQFILIRNTVKKCSDRFFLSFRGLCCTNLSVKAFSAI